MTITVELTARMQAELARQAEMNGQQMEIRAASLLEEALNLSQTEFDRTAGKEAIFGDRLLAVFAEARRSGLFADGGLDLPRDPSPGRPVDLS